MKEFFNALHGNFSIVITKKDGTFSDETANFRYYYPPKQALNGLKQMRKIAERTDLMIDNVSICEESEGNAIYSYLLIGLKEI